MNRLSTIKWSATTVLVSGTIINNLHIYPLGAIIMSVGGLLWLTAAYYMRDRPLIVTNIMLSIVGIGALIIGVTL